MLKTNFLFILTFLIYAAKIAAAYNCLKHEYPLSNLENRTGVIRTKSDCQYGCMVSFKLII